MILGQNPHYVGNAKTEEEKQALIEKYGNQALRPAVKMSKSLGNVVNPDDVVEGLRRGHHAALYHVHRRL